MTWCKAFAANYLLYGLLVSLQHTACVAEGMPQVVEEWRLGLQRWDFADNCSGTGAPCEPSWKQMTGNDWKIHGLWPGPSASSTPPQPETLSCNPTQLNTTEAWLTAAVGADQYQRMLVSWSAHNQNQMADANIHKAPGALSAGARDQWAHEWIKHGTCTCLEMQPASKDHPKSTDCGSGDLYQARFINAVLALYDHLMGATDVVRDCCNSETFDCTFHIGIDPSTLKWAPLGLPGTDSIYACIPKTIVGAGEGQAVVV